MNKDTGGALPPFEMDLREQAAVPRWEVKQMIMTAVQNGIQTYDEKIALPRHTALVASVEKGNAIAETMSRTLEKVWGGVSVLKWIASAVVTGLGAGGGLLAWARIMHHNY